MILRQAPSRAYEFFSRPQSPPGLLDRARGALPRLSRSRSTQLSDRKVLSGIGRVARRGSSGRGRASRCSRRGWRSCGGGRARRSAGRSPGSGGRRGGSLEPARAGARGRGGRRGRSCSARCRPRPAARGRGSGRGGSRGSGSRPGYRRSRLEGSSKVGVCRARGLILSRGLPGSSWSSLVGNCRASSSLEEAGELVEADVAGVADLEPAVGDPALDRAGRDVGSGRGLGRGQPDVRGRGSLRGGPPARRDDGGSGSGSRRLSRRPGANRCPSGCGSVAGRACHSYATNVPSSMSRGVGRCRWLSR